MSTFSTRSHAEFFGKALLEEVLQLMPELQAEYQPPPTAADDFLEHLCSPVIHPLHMPSGAEDIYEEYEFRAPLLFEDGSLTYNQLLELIMLTEAGEFPILNNIKPPPTKKQKEQDHLKQITKKGVDLLNRHNKGKHAFQHMKKEFHRAFNVNHETGEEGPDDDKATWNSKVKKAQNHFNHFMHKRGALTKGGKHKLFTANGKTEASKDAPLKHEDGKEYKGVITKGLSMSPAGASGYHHNLCPCRTKECEKSCLGTEAGGNKLFPYAAGKAKLVRTQYVHEHPHHAAVLMSHELGHNEKAAKKKGYKAGARLNVTSDIPYEHLMPKKFFNKHKDTQFYDYTKQHGRIGKDKVPSNYHLTLSHTGSNHDESNDKHVINHLRNGGVVAMVHRRTGSKGSVPPHTVRNRETGESWKVHAGDNNDNTFEHIDERKKKQGVVRSLKLKGVNSKKAGNFANRVDHNGVIWVGKHASGGKHPEEGEYKGTQK